MKTKVAIADDHSLVRQGLETLIRENKDYEVIMSAADGQALVDEIEKRNLEPDIVVLDVNMPRLNGFETAAWLKEHKPETKVLALTMFDDQNVVIKMLKHGAKGFILKNGDARQLFEALDDLRDAGYHFNHMVTGRMLEQADKTGQQNEKPALTKNEETFLKYCCSELTYKEIADRMNLSVRTVEGYRDSLFSKYQINSRVGLAILAIRLGFANI